jgi:hypothetical protein
MINFSPDHRFFLIREIPITPPTALPPAAESGHGQNSLYTQVQAYYNSNKNRVIWHEK